MCVCVFAHTSECLSLCECECVNLMCSALYKEAKAGPVTFSTLTKKSANKKLYHGA